MGEYGLDRVGGMVCAAPHAATSEDDPGHGHAVALPLSGSPQPLGFPLLPLTLKYRYILLRILWRGISV